MSGPGNKPRPVVLIVEDEPMQRMMLVDLVEKAGLEALEVAAADDAVRILETRLDIRIVFADIDMPGGVDGMIFAAAIRERWPPIEIIVTSSRRVLKLEELPIRGLFFPKPYQQSQVVDAIVGFAA